MLRIVELVSLECQCEQCQREQCQREQCQPTTAGAADAAVIMGLHRAGQIGWFQRARLLRLPSGRCSRPRSDRRARWAQAVIGGGLAVESDTMAAELVRL